MLVIREAQIAALQADVVARFDRSLSEHLKRFAPREAQVLGNEGVLAIVHLGRRRAAEFNFTDRESIRLYVELMFLLGSGFSTDPQYPWAAQALAARGEAQGQRQRACALYSNAIEYLHKVLGAKREFVSSAVRRLTDHRLRDFLNFGPLPESLSQKLSIIFPEKFAYLGADRVRALVQSATVVARQHDLIGAAAPVLVTVLMFLLGHEVDRDPINPWVAATLRDTISIEPSTRIEILENRIWEELRDGMGRLA
jgi:hypothetical protein